jgi:RNA polymerase sigma factor (sigma-70 family)
MLSERDLVLCELLVLRCRRRDAVAATELTALFQRPLLYYLRRMVADEQAAWDLSQETWMRVFSSLGALRDPRSLPAYLYRVAHHVALAYLRKRQVPLSLEESGVEPETSEAPNFTPDEAAQVHAALSLLSLRHREVLMLHFLEDLSLQEIADVVGVPVGTVKSRLFHARRAMRSILERGDRHAE